MDLARSFGNLKVLVIGDSMLDVYVEGSSTRSCPEDPEAPVFVPGSVTYCPGGAANVAANCSALGAEVRLLAASCPDEDGRRLAATLEFFGVDGRIVQGEPDRRTVRKERLIAGGRAIARLDTGTEAPLSEHKQRELIGQIRRLWPWADVVIVADYAKGLMTSRVIGAVAALAAESRKTLVVDGKDLGFYVRCRPTAVTPNYREALALIGLEPDTFAAHRTGIVSTVAVDLLAATGASIVAVTLDAEGVITLDIEGRPAWVEASAAGPACTSGAGDTFAAAFAMALGSGASRFEAAEVAQRAADVAVSKPYTATCSARELFPEAGPKVVLATGCFDILHAGHVSLLKRARELGDRLVVGLNTDESVAAIKPGRPINGLGDRFEVLDALACVDEVRIMDSPETLIRELRPAVFVKGGDYTRGLLPEADLVEQLGGRVEILPLLEGRSTSEIVARCNESRV